MFCCKYHQGHNTRENLSFGVIGKALITDLIHNFTRSTKAADYVLIQLARII